jgi:hypothetical protein
MLIHGSTGRSSLKLTANMLFLKLKQIAGKVETSSENIERKDIISMFSYMPPVDSQY